MAIKARVLDAMNAVPRQNFVPAEVRDYAHSDGPLPIGWHKTISQPFITALMTELLELEAGMTVLEIGTGLGYHTALLSQLAHQVYTVEIVEELAEEAERRLREFGCANVAYKVGNGTNGWPEHAPYDAVIVTAAAETPPPALVEQLAPGGRMAIPLGPRREGQELCLLIKGADGQVAQRAILPVAFVPLVSGPRCQD